MNNLENKNRKIDYEINLNDLEKITGSTSDEEVLTQAAKIVNIRIKDIIHPDRVAEALQVLHTITAKTPTRSKDSPTISKRLMLVVDAINYAFYEHKKYLRVIPTPHYKSFYKNDTTESIRSKNDCAMIALKTLSKIMTRTSNKEVLRKVVSTYYIMVNEYSRSMSSKTMDIASKQLWKARQAVAQADTQPKSITKQPELSGNPAGRDEKC